MPAKSTPKEGPMKLKDLAVKVKAGPQDGLAEGEFTAYASVFGNKDSYGDIVDPGAFEDTLKEWFGGGEKLLPLLFGHRMDDPDFNIGYIKAAEEDERGLLVHGVIDLDSPKGVTVYRLLKGKRVHQLSYAYDVLDAEEADDGFHLKSLRLHEVSIVPVGANQLTEVLAVKADAIAVGAQLKAGRVLAQKHIDSIRGAYDALADVLAAAENSGGSTDDNEKANEAVKVKTDANDEDHKVKSPAPADEPETKHSPAALLSAQIEIAQLAGQEGV